MARWGVKIDGARKMIVTINASTGKPIEEASIPINQSTVFFKAECNFIEKKDLANFFYSLDGNSWIAIGSPLRMSYTLPHFMGYRFGLFYYATRNTGGYADFDYFRIVLKNSTPQ